MVRVLDAISKRILMDHRGRLGGFDLSNLEKNLLRDVDLRTALRSLFPKTNFKVIINRYDEDEENRYFDKIYKGEGLGIYVLAELSEKLVPEGLHSKDEIELWLVTPEQFDVYYRKYQEDVKNKDTTKIEEVDLSLYNGPKRNDIHGNKVVIGPLVESENDTVIETNLMEQVVIQYTNLNLRPYMKEWRSLIDMAKKKYGVEVDRPTGGVHSTYDWARPISGGVIFPDEHRRESTHPLVFKKDLDEPEDAKKLREAINGVYRAGLSLSEAIKKERKELSRYLK